MPILTHCEGGTRRAASRSVCWPTSGSTWRTWSLSHVDKVVDRGYHRDLLSTGAVLEYDQSFRWGEAPNGTIRLIAWMAEDGLADRIVLGMDAARRRYYRVFGGSPGLTWLLDGFTEAMAAAGIDSTTRHALFVDNPARAYAFARA